MSDEFEAWWFALGSGLHPNVDEDKEEHSRRVAQAAWDKATEVLLAERDEARRQRDEAVAMLRFARETITKIPYSLAYWSQHPHLPKIDAALAKLEK